MITKLLKQTLQDSHKFLTLSLTITLLKKCIDECLRLGISPESISFIVLGLQKIASELEEGAEFIKIKEDFNNITKDINIKENNDV